MLAVERDGVAGGGFRCLVGRRVPGQYPDRPRGHRTGDTRSTNRQHPSPGDPTRRHAHRPPHDLSKVYLT